MHIFTTIIIAAAVLLAAVLSIPAYLSIDDLHKCAEPGTAECEKADAIVAISGGDTEARADEAVRLYFDGWADKLIFSGAALDKTGPSNASVMQKRAIAAGVPSAAIIIDEIADNTEQNAITTSLIIRSKKLSHIILVTSPYHQRRAYIEFKQALPASTIITNHPTPRDRLWPPFWWLTPSGWNLAFEELTKTIFVHVWSSVWPTST